MTVLMDVSPIVLDIRRRPYVLADLYPTAPGPPDITQEMLDRFFPDLPGGSQIIWRHGCIVGKPGCGKTELIKARAKYAVDKYGPDNVNVVYTDDLRVAIACIDDKPVQYLIVDDASKNMASRRIHAQTDVLGTFNRLRHHFSEYLKGKAGIVICEFAWQRWMELDPGFRDGTSIIFKTNMSSKSEKKLVADTIGWPMMRRLDGIWDSIDRGVNAAKSYSVGRIGPKAPEAGGAGIYRMGMVDFPEFPELMRGEDYLDDDGTFDRDSARKRRAYNLNINGKTQTEIAKILGVAQQSVSRWIIEMGQGGQENEKESVAECRP